ncbi:alanine aminotransferase 2-like [Pholidichthys leucotaenia]
MTVFPQNALQNLAADTEKEISEAVQKPLKRAINVSICDPHRAGMKPITFVRQVLAACLFPELLKDKTLPLDVMLRAQRFLEVCEGGSVGSYTPSSGLDYVRQRIAESITNRDGAPSYGNNIFVSAGSQRALMVVLKLLINEEGKAPTGVLAPVPSPFTLPLLLETAGATLVPYRLTEERGWAVEVDQLRRAVKTARGCCEPRAIYICNPGVPTGHVQDRKSIEEVILFAATERLLLLADEVYQDSVFGQDRQFISYKKVLSEMDKDLAEMVELVSFNSLSSTYTGECGLRAGYMETVNLDPEVMYFVDNVLCCDISTPVIGQLALDLMLHPPKPGDCSYNRYRQETLLTRATLSRNAQRAQELLNSLPGMSCQPVIGGIYVYPRLQLPSEIREQAKQLGMEAGVLYCQKLLEEEGVLVGVDPQDEDGTHHYRVCILVPCDIMDEALSRLSSFHVHLMNGHCDIIKDGKDINKKKQ